MPTIADLKHILRINKLPLFGTKAVLQARVDGIENELKTTPIIEHTMPKVKKSNKSYLEQQTVKSLKSILKHHKFPVAGSKPVLIARLIEAGLDNPDVKKIDLKVTPQVYKKMNTVEKTPKADKSYLEKQTVKSLKMLLKHYGMLTTGLKPVLVARLNDAGINTPDVKKSDYVKKSTANLFADEEANPEDIGRPAGRIDTTYDSMLNIHNNQVALQKELGTYMNMLQNIRNIQYNDPEDMQEAQTYSRKEPSQYVLTARAFIKENPSIGDINEILQVHRNMKFVIFEYPKFDEALFADDMYKNRDLYKFSKSFVGCTIRMEQDEDGVVSMICNNQSLDGGESIVFVVVDGEIIDDTEPDEQEPMSSASVLVAPIEGNIPIQIRIPMPMPMPARRPVIVDTQDPLEGIMYKHPTDPDEYDFYADMIEPHVIINNHLNSFIKQYNNPRLTVSNMLISDMLNIIANLDIYRTLNKRNAEFTMLLNDESVIDIQDKNSFIMAIDKLKPFLMPYRLS